MKFPLRKLSDAGIEKFQLFLSRLRDGAKDPIPHDLLTSASYSDIIPQQINIEQRKFKSRYELGKYLVEALSPCDLKAISYDIGLWSWLALFYFDQLCPQDKNGLRKPKRNDNYILSRNFRKRERHSIRTTYFFVKSYGEKVLFMFGKELHIRGEITEQLSQRQDYLSSEGIMIAASILYNDLKTKTFKKGSAAKGRGVIRRFVKVLQQFDATHDLFSMQGIEIVNLLPEEFDKFRHT